MPKSSKPQPVEVAGPEPECAVDAGPPTQVLGKRTRPPGPHGRNNLRTLACGTIDRNWTYEVTRYTWWNSHEGSTSQIDRKFESKRMALLYAAKCNSEELEAHADACGMSWSQLPCFAATGHYSLSPNTPFDLERFLTLSDEELQEWCNEVCNAFSRLVCRQQMPPSDAFDRSFDSIRCL